MIERGTALNKAIIPVIIILLFASFSYCSVSHQTDFVSTEKLRSISDGGLQNSSWPMFCHDVSHTGRSPYSTKDNNGFELWRFTQYGDLIRGSPIIGDDGTIYIGGSRYFFAIYPNGTLKWSYFDLGGYVSSAPAIDKNGTVYFGLALAGGIYYFYALYPNGTLKWMVPTWEVYSSPAIAQDGTIYFGDQSNHIYARYPNGTLKWSYQTGDVVLSSPAIGSDGTVYCGSHDTYLYALYPNNGTLKWRFKTGDWIRVSPCIADDGTIYIVSLDNYLYAIYPNGTMKWKTNVGAGTSPTIGQDGTIYCGYSNLNAVNPTNGSIRWTFNPGPGRTIRGATPCNSADGTIYFGTWIGDYSGGEIIAVNPNGTEQWRRYIANVYVDSAPAIGKDGTVYIGTAWSENGYSRGSLIAFGRGPLEAEANGPYYGLTNQSVNFTGSATGGYKPYSWHWDFGDGHTSQQQNPNHTYVSIGNYTVTLTVTDNTSNISTDTTWAWIQQTNTPPNSPTITGPSKGKPGIPYNYTFVTSDPDGTSIWYYIQWGDGTNSGWIGPYSSNDALIVSHTWHKRGTYTIQAKAKDGYGAESSWGTLKVTMPLSYEPPHFRFLDWLFERFPNAFPILRNLLGFNQC